MNTKRRQIFLILVIALVITVGAFPAFASTTRYTVKKGTPVKMVISHNIDSSCDLLGKMGDVVKFETMDEIVAPDGTVLVKKHALATGTVTSIVENNMWGNSGKIKIQIRNVKAVDSSLIELMSPNIVEKGENYTWESGLITLVILYPAALLQGEQAVIHKGEVFTATVAKDSPVRFNRQKCIKVKGDTVAIEIKEIGNGYISFDPLRGKKTLFTHEEIEEFHKLFVDALSDITRAENRNKTFNMKYIGSVSPSIRVNILRPDKGEEAWIEIISGGATAKISKEEGFKIMEALKPFLRP